MKRWISQKFLWGIKEEGKQQHHTKRRASVNVGWVIGAFSTLPTWALGPYHMRGGWSNTLAKTPHLHYQSTQAFKLQKGCKAIKKVVHTTCALSSKSSEV